MEVHRPKGPVARGPHTSLAPRPAAPTRLALVATMPPGSGVELVAEEILAGLATQGIQSEIVPRRTHLSVDPADQEPLRTGGFDAVVFVVGPSTTVLGVAYAAASELETAGLPCLLVVPEALRSQNAHEATRADAPVRSVEQAGAQAPELELVLAALREPLRPEELDPAAVAVAPPPTMLRGSEDELRAEFADAGWTDGLPIVLPTPARVEAMLGGTSRSADEVVVPRLPPEGGAVTVLDVAIVAVLAGAAPVHLPVVLAAASLAGDPLLDSMTRSVNSFAFAQLVSGPYAQTAGMSGGLGALSQDSQGNAVVGRALGLLQRTAGGARLGESISPVQGNVAARGFAFAEDAPASPWPAFHEALGFAPHESTVTLFSGGQAHLGNFYYDDLEAIAAAMTSVDLFSGALVLLSAKRAAEAAAAGMSREDVAATLRDRARVRLGDFRRSGFYPLRSAGIARGGDGTWPRHYLDGDDEELVPAFPPGSIDVAVVGSSLSSLAQVWYMRRHGSASIDDWR